MKLLQDKTNVALPNSEYPYGQIRDRDGLVMGTPGSVELYGDMHQFFENLIRESDVDPNDLPDNEYNTYQLWDSFLEHVKNLRNYQRYFAKISQSGTSAPTVEFEAEADFGSPVTITRTLTGRYVFTFAGTPIDITGKTFIECDSNFNGYVSGSSISTSAIQLISLNTSGFGADSLFQDTDIFIYVYD